MFQPRKLVWIEHIEIVDQESAEIQISEYLTLDGVRPLGPTALGTPNQLHLEGSQPCLGSIFV